MPKIVDENNVQVSLEDSKWVSETEKKIAIFIATEHAWVILPLKQWIIDLISIISNRTNERESIENAKDACNKLDLILEERKRIKSNTLMHSIDFFWFYQDEW